MHHPMAGFASHSQRTALKHDSLTVFALSAATAYAREAACMYVVYAVKSQPLVDHTKVWENEYKDRLQFEYTHPHQCKLWRSHTPKPLILAV
jgi:hypothetical protein